MKKGNEKRNDTGKEVRGKKYKESREGAQGGKVRNGRKVVDPFIFNRPSCCHETQQSDEAPVCVLVGHLFTSELHFKLFLQFTKNPLLSLSAFI